MTYFVGLLVFICRVVVVICRVVVVLYFFCVLVSIEVLVQGFGGGGGGLPSPRSGLPAIIPDCGRTCRL